MLHESTVLDPATAVMLHELGTILTPQGFFLVGGTALAIQLNHRKSIDLDFFIRDHFNKEQVLDTIRSKLANNQRIEILGKAENTLNLVVDSVKIDLIRYRYPLLKPVLVAENYEMVSRADIAAMKLSAIANRGTKKDFFDLYFLLREFALKEILEFYREKFEGHDPFFVLRSLTYFDDAEDEPDPMMIATADWNSVKSTIAETVRKLV